MVYFFTSFRIHNLKKFDNTGEDLEDLISIDQNLDILNEREQEVIKGRFGLEHGGKERRLLLRSFSQSGKSALANCELAVSQQLFLKLKLV